MIKSYFITGTDTEVGKTFVTAALLRAFIKLNNQKTIGMKPVAAGARFIEGELQNEDVAALKVASNVQVKTSLVCPYLFEIAAAPHIAARAVNRTIQLDPILEAYQTLTSLADVVLVEGVGGFDVPLQLPTQSSKDKPTKQDGLSTADLAAKLQLPVILVVGLRLGCLNHALLTAQAIQAKGLTIAGWVGNTLDLTLPYLSENIAALHQLMPAPCIGIAPYMTKASPCHNNTIEQDLIRFENLSHYLDIRLLP